MDGSSSQIERFRRFNRTVTRRIGILQDRFLGRDRPLGESRLLYEIGPDGCEIRTLRARLGLDSGYVSRLLRSLEAQGLVETGPSPGDTRVKCAWLTRKGHDERSELDRLSNEGAAAILSGLDAGRREQLAVAMDTVERLLRASETTIAPEPANSASAAWCLEQYYALLNERFEGGYDPGSAQPASHTDFMPPGGIFLVARMAGRPVGCIGLRTLEPGIGEIKRLWVADEARGLGLGQRLLTEAHAHARRLALNTLRLDTNRTLTEARALYLKNGYVEVPAFNDDPYPDHWFEKRL